MSVRVWNDGSKTTQAGAIGADMRAVSDHPPDGGEGQEQGMTVMGECMGMMDRHTEFVNGLDWCLFGAEGWCASVGWDERVLIWDVREFMGRRGFG